MAAPAPARADDPGQAAVPDDFVLEESAAGWTLTIRLTERLLDAIATSAEHPEHAPGFSVAIRPNLVPGEPFVTSVVVERPPTV